MNCQYRKGRSFKPRHNELCLYNMFHLQGIHFTIVPPTRGPFVDCLYVVLSSIVHVSVDDKRKLPSGYESLPDKDKRKLLSTKVKIFVSKK